MATEKVTPTQRRFPLLRAWWAADRGGVFRTIALIVALVSFVALWPSLTAAGGATPVLRNIVVHGYVLTWLMLVSIGVRSIGLRQVIPAFLLGMFAVPLVVFVPLTPVTNRLGSSSQALAVWWVPPVEELALLGGTMLIAWRLCRRAGRRPGVLDLIVVGWSIGSGYAIHEDGLYGRFLANLNGSLGGAFDGPYGLLFPTFPEAGSGVTLYHSGHGAIYGLVVGVVIAWYHRRRLVRWLVPLTWLWATFSHGLHNHQLWSGPSPLRFLNGNGHLFAILLVLAVPAVLVLEHLRRRRTDVGLPAFGWAGVREAIRRGHSAMDTTVRLLAYGHYHRGRNAALMAAWQRPEAGPPPIRGLEAWGRIAFAPPQRGRPGPPGRAPHQDVGAPQ